MLVTALHGQVLVITMITTLAIREPTTPGTIGITEAVGGVASITDGVGAGVMAVVGVTDMDAVVIMVGGIHTMLGDIIIMGTTITAAGIMASTMGVTTAAAITVKDRLRACSLSRSSSLFGAILADFRFFNWGQYTKFDINPK
jgi:hypothetical protein